MTNYLVRSRISVVKENHSPLLNGKEFMVYIIVILASIFAMPAKADETLKSRVFGHTTSFQSQDVGDVDGHAVIIARVTGLASFPDGSVAAAYWTVQGDFIKNAGPALAYVNVTFQDGSVLWYKAPV